MYRPTMFHTRNLSGNESDRTDMSDQNLSNMNLSGWRCQYCDFSRANLTNTNLEGADLTFSVGLTAKQLSYAKFSTIQIDFEDYLNQQLVLQAKYLQEVRQKMGNHRFKNRG